jgi:carbon monoxide dehydrogenase subunit G
VQLEHSFSVPVGIDEAWKILLDVERIGPCLPGAVIDSIDGDDFTGTVKVKLGPINLSYKGKASFVEKDEAARRAVIDARGKDARGNGTATALVTATLTDEGGSTSVQVNTDLDITGKPAQFGRGVMVDVGNKLLGQFADALAATISAGDRPAAAEAAAAEPDVVPAAEPTPAAETAPAKRTRPKPSRARAAEQEADAAPDSTDDAPAPADATPAYSVPGGVPTDADAVLPPDAIDAPTVADRSSAPATRPMHDVEPIDLLKSAGPAVAKRLAGPAAVALVITLIAVRRRQQRG